MSYNLMIERPVVVLPQPDSPTIPIHSPSYKSNEMLETAFNLARFGPFPKKKNCFKCLTESKIFFYLNAVIFIFLHFCGKIIKTEPKNGVNMEAKYYTVSKIEGEYAYLRDDAKPGEDDLFIAVALLPYGIDVGTKLHYEMLSYTVIE